MAKNPDYKKVGLKCGIEIHRRLDTHKLFCKCSSLLEDEEIGEIERCLRASKSELGEIDPAALHEFKKGKKFRYKAYRNSSCLVEMDEEPPNQLNSDALKIVLEIALLLNAKPVDEVHFMRKMVIDGSNTSGFQRTAIIGMNGYLETSFGRVEIPTVCLEEESAQIVEKRDEEMVYGLNRLCIPLVEVSTAPVLDHPDRVKEVALKLGNLLKACRVMRGIGSIRQDVNISIKGGARVEIKGVQEPDLIPTIVKNEVERQLSLISLKNEMRKKRIKFSDITDVSRIFKKSKCRFLKSKTVLALKIEGLGGTFRKKLNEFRTIGREVSDYVRAKTKLGGIIHTDEELEKYGISISEIRGLRESLGAKKGDLIIMVASDDSRLNELQRAMKVVKERVSMLKDEVPEETRRALENGDTEYMRPLPGAARMYPETDVPPVRIEERLLSKIRSELPETPEEKMMRFMKKLKLNRELASQLINSKHLALFERLVKKHRSVEPKLVATLLLNTLPELKARERLDITAVREEWLDALLEMIGNGSVAKDAAYEILRLCLVEKNDPESVVKKHGLLKASESEIRRVVRDCIRKYGKNRKIIGMVMKELKFRADGVEILRMVEEELAE